MHGSFIANKSVMLYKKDGERNLQNLLLLFKCESYLYILTQDLSSVRPKKDFGNVFISISHRK